MNSLNETTGLLNRPAARTGLNHNDRQLKDQRKSPTRPSVAAQRTVAQQKQTHLNSTGNREKYLNYLNSGVAGISAATNAVAFVAKSLGLDSAETVGEYAEMSTRASVASGGITGAIDTHDKNGVAFTGNIIETGFGLFAKGQEIWNWRGISQSIINLRNIVERVTGKANFNTFGEAFKETLAAAKGTYSEISHNVLSMKKPGQALLGASTFQFAGPFIGLFHAAAGSFIRNFPGGIGADVSYMLFNKSGKAFDIASEHTQAGVAWMAAAVPDFLRHLVPNLEGMDNLTQTFAQIGSARFNTGNLRQQNSPELALT